MRNILLMRKHASEYREISIQEGGYGICRFEAGEVRAALGAVGFMKGMGQVPLSVLAVEVVQEPGEALKTDPLGYGLGSVRVLRASGLVEVMSRC